MSDGIELKNCVHTKCGEKKLIDFGGYVWCDKCKKIANPDDILSEEEWLNYLLKLTEKYRKK